MYHTLGEEMSRKRASRKPANKKRRENLLPRKEPVSPNRREGGSGRKWIWAAGGLLAVGMAVAVYFGSRPGKPPVGEIKQKLAAAEGWFTDVTDVTEIAFIHTTGQETHRMLYPEIMGAGMILFDYDNDGDLDIYFLNGNYLRGKPHDPNLTNALHRNEGNWRFTDVTHEAGVADSGYGQGGEAADFDNDGDQDLYVTNYGPNVYFRNEGNGKFTRTALLAHPAWGQCCSALDYDNDGDLDIYLVNYLTYDHTKQDLGREVVAGKFIHEYQGPQVYEGSPDVLYRNDGNDVFTDVTREVGLYYPGGKGMGLAVCDYDNDGDPDIFVANDMMVNYLFENKGGRFVERGVEAGVAVSNDGNVESSMGVDVADVDNDGLFDIMVPCRHREIHTLYHNEWPVFTESPAHSGMDAATLGYTGFSPSFLDYDSDGDMDLFVSTGEVVTSEEAVLKGLTRPEHFYERYAQVDLLLENDGRGYFRRVAPAKAGAHFLHRTIGRGTAAGDLDNDGDIDIVVNVSEGRPIILRNNANESGRGGHWLTLKLIGTKSNRDAIGARVVATVHGTKQYHYLRGGGSYLSVSDRRIRLGLGSATTVERIEITWPSGTKQTIEKVAPVDRFLTVREPSAEQ